MKYRGIPACSVEINPYLHFVGTIKTRTYTNLSDIEVAFAEFTEVYASALKLVPFKTDPRGYLFEQAKFIPRISYPDRWWSEGNLAQLVCLRKLLNEREQKSVPDDLLRMAALAILVPVSNAKHNHVSLTYADEPLPTVDVAAVFKRQLSNMVNDLRAVGSMPTADVTVYQGNSKQLSRIIPHKERKISAVITSPPYPNRFSYARETRPHLFFFDFIESAKAVGQLETEAIGGTWGKATSVLANGVAPKNELIGGLLKPYIGGIRTNGHLMAHYVTKYFNDVYDHAQQVDKVCDKRARLAYVIGNSKFYDHPLPSDEILADIFGHFGFALDRIDRMRKRQSKSGLYESVVFMQRG
jgi:hypothetical protein